MDGYAAAIVKERKLDIKAWDPLLIGEFKAFSDKVWKPFGALFPRWKNSPRRGFLPVEIQVVRPDGTLSSFSCADVLEEGHLRFRLPVAQNAPAGKWTVKARELASGKSAATSFQLH